VTFHGAAQQREDVFGDAWEETFLSDEITKQERYN
jgi:hypothetical protein